MPRHARGRSLEDAVRRAFPGAARTLRSACRRGGRGLALVTAVLALASCGTHVASIPPLPSPPHLGGTGPAIARIQRAGTLRVASDLSYPPMAFRDDSGPKGFDVDVAMLLAEALGVHLAVIDTPLAVLRLGVPRGADMAIGALPSGTVPGRASGPYYMLGQAIVSPGRAAVGAIAGLRGLRVAVVAGSPGAGVARQAGASVVALTFLPEPALAAVAAGQVQAAVVDEPLARGYAADHQGLTVAAAGAAAVPLVAVVSESAPDLAAFVTDALRELGRNGGLGRLRERWHL